MSPMPAYRGRFAPSPTGPLHFGSLVAAAASYLDAREHDGEWLVRMEDVDMPRTQPGAADSILRDLEAFGFQWAGPVMYQSHRTEAYRAALASLQSKGAVYPCGCTRQDLDETGRYPGTCANGLLPGRTARSWRVRVPNEPTAFVDRLLGPQTFHLAEFPGDFVLLRADGIFAYQLAVVVDDAEQGITDIVRGADLLDSTPRQIHLQRLLGYLTPSYMHVPVVTNDRGEKLSKQTHAPPLDASRAPQLLCEALRFLGHEPCECSNVADVWATAIRARPSRPQSS